MFPPTNHYLIHQKKKMERKPRVPYVFYSEKTGGAAKENIFSVFLGNSFSGLDNQKKSLRCNVLQGFFKVKLKAKHCKTLDFPKSFGLLPFNPIHLWYILTHLCIASFQKKVDGIVCIYLPWYVSTLSSTEFIKNDQSIISSPITVWSS